MNDKLSLSCSGTEREGAGVGVGGGGGAMKGGQVGLRKGRRYLHVMDERAGERGQFQSRVKEGMGGGGEGGVHV